MSQLQYTPSFFKECEFVHAVPSCSMHDMHPDVLERLDYARSLFGKPIIICSAYRSREHELAHGRAGTSSHCKGEAVDVKCVDSTNRLELVQSLLRAGFRRIGIHSRFIHVDIDHTKPRCMWLYDSKSELEDDF